MATDSLVVGLWFILWIRLGYGSSYLAFILAYTFGLCSCLLFAVCCLLLNWLIDHLVNWLFAWLFHWLLGWLDLDGGTVMTSSYFGSHFCIRTFASSLFILHFAFCTYLGCSAPCYLGCSMLFGCFRGVVRCCSFVLAVSFSVLGVVVDVVLPVGVVGVHMWHII